MKDFEKINWEIYNKPPFYQQWLCTDETLKLVMFGDRGLAEIDDQILLLKDQWNLDKVKGRSLDRIGKVLNEKRNANTDEFYRKILKLRTLLNTNDGSIPDIIKAIKFLYSAEVVHIVPNYPAGLIIETDGEGTPGLNFNKILIEVIPAGVSFSTKLLYHFREDEWLVDDDFMITKATMALIDTFRQGIKFDGSILHDGSHKATQEGIKDIFGINLGMGGFFDGFFFYPLRHDGKIKANGAYLFNGRSGGDLLAIKSKASLMDDFPVTDNDTILMRIEFFDCFTTHHKFSGTFLHNGKIKAAVAKDNLHFATIRMAAEDHLNAEDELFIGKRYHRKHNGRYKANGNIKFNTGVLIPA